MFHAGDGEVSRKQLRLRTLQTRPVEAVRTFACKVSASFRRQTTSARRRYRKKFRQLEAKFLNSAEGEAGLIFAVPNIPAHIAPAELASALNDTLARLCNASQEIHFSSPSLSPDSSGAKDLLDFEHETHWLTSTRPQMATHPDLLLPELSDSAAAAEPHSTSHVSIDDLLCHHGRDERLQAPLLPTTRQGPAAERPQEPLMARQAPPDPLDFLKTLAFQDLSPYPLASKANTAAKRALVRTRTGAWDTDKKKALPRRQSSRTLRHTSINSINSIRDDSVVARPTAHPQCLRPGPLNIHRTRGRRRVPRALPTRTDTPPREASSSYIAYQQGQTHLLPVAPPTANTLMEEMTTELDRVWAVFDSTNEEHAIPDQAPLEARSLGPRHAVAQPIVPLRISSKAASTASQSTPRRSISFKARLRDASRSAILCAAEEADTSELRWFHCRA